MTVTGNAALFASMNRYTSTGCRCSPGRRRRPLLLDLTLLAQPLAFLTRQTLTLAGVDLSLLDPVANRLRRAPQILATSRHDTPMSVTSLTARWLNSSGYGVRDPCLRTSCRTHRPNSPGVRETGGTSSKRGGRWHPPTVAGWPAARDRGQGPVPGAGHQGSAFLMQKPLKRMPNGA